MENLITIFSVIVGSTALSSLVQFFVKRHDDKDEYSPKELSKELNDFKDEIKSDISDIKGTQVKICKAQKEYMQDKLCHLAEKYAENGEISLAVRGNYKEMYSAYEALGEPCETAKEALAIVESLPLKKGGKK